MEDYGEIKIEIVDAYGMPENDGEYVEIIYEGIGETQTMRVLRRSAAIIAVALAELNLSQRIVEILDPAPGQPFFIVQNRMEPWKHYAWCQRMVEMAKEKGGTFCRFSSDDHDPHRVILEAWKTMPASHEDQGDVRWNYVEPTKS